MHVYFGNKKFDSNELVGKHSHLELQFLNQQHTTNIDIEPKISEASDGYQWIKPNKAVIIKTADCLPLIVLDHTDRVITNLHCGRVGLVDGILLKFLKITNPHNSFSFFIGPHIQTYEIGRNLYLQFKEIGLDCLYTKEQSYYFSLQNFTKKFISENFKIYKIYEADINTFSNNLYWSYRKDKETKYRNFNFAYFEE